MSRCGLAAAPCDFRRLAGAFFTKPGNSQTGLCTYVRVYA